MTIQDAMIKVSQCSPEHLIEFGSMKREELKAAVEVDVSSFEVFHSEKIANDGKIMGSWSMKKIL
ncbi:MAG: hypothetical protein J6E48_08870 [Prevotella sp.]|nr:hypothetical protein [Prevotella sp.]